MCWDPGSCINGNPQAFFFTLQPSFPHHNDGLKLLSAFLSVHFGWWMNIFFNKQQFYWGCSATLDQTWRLQEVWMSWSGHQITLSKWAPLHTCWWERSPAWDHFQILQLSPLGEDAAEVIVRFRARLSSVPFSLMLFFSHNIDDISPQLTCQHRTRLQSIKTRSSILWSVQWHNTSVSV